MTEEINMAIDDLKSSNQKSLTHLEAELRKIRTGKASPDMLESVQVDYYGTPTPLSQVANVGTLDARTLTIQPWEKAMLEECTKAIINANLGLSPQDNGEMLIINIPQLTEERRIELAKQAKAVGENSKISIRNNRKDAMDFIKSLQKEGVAEDTIKISEENIQNITNDYTKKIDDLIELKEKDIMKV